MEEGVPSATDVLFALKAIESLNVVFAINRRFYMAARIAKFEPIHEEGRKSEDDSLFNGFKSRLEGIVDIK